MPADLPGAILAHAELALTALALAALIGLPSGIYASNAGDIPTGNFGGGSSTHRARALRSILLGLAGIGRTLPSLAVLAFMLPLLGVGFAPAVVALVLLAVPPIVIATDVGLRGVPTAAIDAARGMGMSERQLFTRVRWPLGLPVILDGLRIAAIEVIASATLATFIGAGGLGDLIVRGLQTNDPALLYWGALTVALLALIAELLGTLFARQRKVI